MLFNPLLRKSKGWFLYDKGLRHERVKMVGYVIYNLEDQREDTDDGSAAYNFPIGQWN